MPLRELPEKPVAWPAGTRDERLLRLPCCASRIPAACAARRRVPHTLRTNPLAPPLPRRMLAARTFRALSSQAQASVCLRIVERSIRKRSALASLLSTVYKYDERCAVACAALSRSIVNIPSMNSIAGPSAGFARSGFRFGSGTASPNASRTSRR